MGYSGWDPPDDRWCPECWRLDPFKDVDEPEPEFGQLCERHARELRDSQREDERDDY